MDQPRFVGQPAAAGTTAEARKANIVIVGTGGTIAGAVQILKDAGAKDVIIAATHPVFSDPAAQRLGECGAREVVVTNTLPIPEEKRFETLTVLSIAPLIARAIREVFEASRTLIWNGPLGAFETPPFDASTVAIAQTVAGLPAHADYVARYCGATG